MFLPVKLFYKLKKHILYIQGCRGIDPRTRTSCQIPVIRNPQEYRLPTAHRSVRPFEWDTHPYCAFPRSPSMLCRGYLHDPSHLRTSEQGVDSEPLTRLEWLYRPVKLSRMWRISCFVPVISCAFRASWACNST